METKTPNPDLIKIKETLEEVLSLTLQIRSQFPPMAKIQEKLRTLETSAANAFYFANASLEETM